MVGGPIDARDLLQPTVSHLVSFGSVQGYFEVYGASAAKLTARFELAASATGGGAGRP